MKFATTKTIFALLCALLALSVIIYYGFQPFCQPKIQPSFPRQQQQEQVAQAPHSDPNSIQLPSTQQLNSRLKQIVSDDFLAKTDLIAKLAGQTMAHEDLYVLIAKTLDTYFFNQNASASKPHKDVWDPALFILKHLTQDQKVACDGIIKLRKKYRAQKQPDHLANWLFKEQPNQLIWLSEDLLVCKKPKEVTAFMCKRYHYSGVISFFASALGIGSMSAKKPVNPSELLGTITPWTKHANKAIAILRTFNACHSLMLAMSHEAALAVAFYAKLG